MNEQHVEQRTWNAYEEALESEVSDEQLTVILGADRLAHIKGCEDCQTMRSDINARVREASGT